ncbi:RNA polymerase sigma-70 factor [Flavitalea sp. BT771]|uniref:RNA polymerase sigma-70 factor n=1 Tax=Flavitalea sp. BT771 TaxID=3063329 RepID=UPI0026E1F55D|nr:RNA polymerase sigma-70 factor [Flavitalea sp. BT771]MDO6431128.1 RNA polymerase sigma-70 factor [Flavitalea sp. BT771]MDV6220035.1 RNA polymerase sigma-70 factor [Flavitalea sp. BT771]
MTVEKCYYFAISKTKTCVMRNDDCPGSSKDMLEQLFNELFREYEHPLYLFAFRMLKSDMAAKDVIQDVFLKLWMIRDRISEIKSISSFLYRLTENKVIDHLRAAAADQKRKQALWQRMHQSSEPHAGVGVEDAEYHTIIHQAIEQLPPQRRAVYLLSHAADKPRKEIASLLHISPNTVKNHLAKAVENIVAYLKNNTD